MVAKVETTSRHRSKVTNNAVELLVMSDPFAENSVVQILRVKLVGNNVVYNVDRYSVVISDGCHWVHGMLADRLINNGLIGKLSRNCTVKVLDYATRFVQGNPIVILLDIEVQSKLKCKIGFPDKYQMNE